MKLKIDREKVAELLLTTHALVSLSMADARQLVSYMLLARFEQGSSIFSDNNQDIGREYMLLVLEGEVLIETSSNGDGSAVVNMLGAGRLIGEMSLIDGEPRSATCTAQTEVEVAMLSRSDLARLMDEYPSIAARFCLAIAKKIADNVRLGNKKLLILTQVNKAMRLELDAQIKRRPQRFGGGRRLE
jgi:CRP/FNR family transcriptional regulator, cyclic AMP receptor protein